MSVIVDQRWDESEEVSLNDGSAELPFVILTSDSSPLYALTARIALYGYLVSLGIDESYHGLQRMNAAFKRDAPHIFTASVKYSRLINQIKFTYDCTAEKVKKTQSLENVANYQVRDVASLGFNGKDFKRLVNVSKDKVDGVDVYDPLSPNKLQFSWSAKYQSIRADYMTTVQELKATVNDDMIYLNYKGQNFGFERGTLLCTGGKFEESNDNGCNITLSFEESVNATGIYLGDIDGSGGNVLTATCDTAAGSTTLVNVAADTVDRTTYGMRVIGANIPANSVIVDYPSSTSIEINAAATGTTVGGAVAFGLPDISKEGWFYLWVDTVKARDPRLSVEVETPNGVHLERMYEYEDFTRLEVFDQIQDQDDDLADEIDELRGAE